MDFSYAHIRYFIGYVYHICLQDTIQSTLSLCLRCQAMLLPMPLRPLLLTTRSGFTILVCHKTRILGFSFCIKREFSDSDFPQNENSPILVFHRTRILVLHKTRILGFSFSTKREFSFSTNFRILVGVSLSRKREFPESRFPQNENSRILVLHKTRILVFHKFPNSRWSLAFQKKRIPRVSFSTKREF